MNVKRCLQCGDSIDPTAYEYRGGPFCGEICKDAYIEEYGLLSNDEDDK